MTEKTNISVSEQFATDILHEHTNKRQLLSTLLDQSIADILMMLSGYYYASRGKVHHLKIDGNSIKFDQVTSGFFTVTFDINYTNGCQDLNYDVENENMMIYFTIDLPNKLVQLTGQEIPERGPDEL